MDHLISYKRIYSSRRTLNGTYNCQTRLILNIFAACLLMIYLPSYQILYPHNQGAVEQKIVSKDFPGKWSDKCLIVSISLLQILIFFSICSWKLRCLSKATPKCFCDSQSWTRHSLSLKEDRDGYRFWDLQCYIHVSDCIRNNITRSLNIFGINKMNVSYCILSKISALLSKSHFQSKTYLFNFT